ncbi:MAG: hypothetical protein D6730_25210 [Bacteroidetes bacterium]|nr:MAG: hypothetical protein D6730_25210 [Bacteroidota bacterium]
MLLLHEARPVWPLAGRNAPFGAIISVHDAGLPRHQMLPQEQGFAALRAAKTYLHINSLIVYT